MTTGNSTTSEVDGADRGVLTTVTRNPGYFPIETAPRDGTRILAWPCDVGWRRIGVGISAGHETVHGWGIVAWDSHYKAWWLSPNEATEYDPDQQPVKWWMPLPPPMDESA